MEPSRLVEQLTRLGLTSYEARAYVALIGRDSFTAAQVARLAGLPRQRIYDVLSSLVDSGLAATRAGPGGKYLAADPTTGVQTLPSTHRQHRPTLEAGASAMVEELATASRAGQEQSDPLEYIEVLRDPGAINARFAKPTAFFK